MRKLTPFLDELTALCQRYGMFLDSLGGDGVTVQHVSGTWRYVVDAQGRDWAEISAMAEDDPPPSSATDLP
jgi:hypothetical protein